MPASPPKVGRMIAAPTKSTAAAWPVALAALLVASACTSLRPAPAGWTDLDFRVRGRIGGRSANEAFSASFDWRQADSRFAVDLWGTLGQGHTRIISDGRRTQVVDAQGTQVAGGDLDTLMDRALGWRVPVQALRHWVVGEPAPDGRDGAPAQVRRDDRGRPATLRQHGWRVEFSDWRQTFLGEVPGKIVAERGHHRFTVLCREWADR